MQTTEHMNDGRRMRLAGADPYLTKRETVVLRGVSESVPSLAPAAPKSAWRKGARRA
jgi:hypothetical protein